MKDRNIDWAERWKEDSREMFDSSEGRKAFENVFDHPTKKSLLKLGDRGVLKRLRGTIESGKESAIFLAETPSDRTVAVKIYMNQAGAFRNMEKYLRGDKRFRNFKSDRRSVIQEWCKKEYRNLDKASRVVGSPETVGYEDNILVMEFLGEQGVPYPRLKEVEIQNPDQALEQVLNGIVELWNQEEIVHGDLSEYNMLVTARGDLEWIDFSQGVHRTHPEAETLLERDVKNIADFFHRQGSDTDPQNACERVFQEVEDL